ncbi:response regulator [Methylobacterium iners]|jgi:CheY-like chemotaxis protein|uniref:Response regulatory domain-containing protein n=1 Tax=Methylobacterium iners TaxID=418707 RepID=A0ABQ4S017_9HYPH|nr:response regulator [Methylobacterium iners]GJD96441.1 hypothetical protein OCOJLMKI_3662 [Methylobacterium iners]
MRRGAQTADDSLAPELSLGQIGQALASFYDDLIAEGVPEHLAALVRQVKQSEDATPRKSGKLALVVEDEAATRAVAEALLEETDLSPIGCDSAEAALEVLRERGGDVALVFADIRLAGEMDGLQLAKAVALLWPQARLVVTSGHRPVRPDALPAQAVFIPKPWRPLDVLTEAALAAGEGQPVSP